LDCNEKKKQKGILEKGDTVGAFVEERGLEGKKYLQKMGSPYRDQGVEESTKRKKESESSYFTIHTLCGGRRGQFIGQDFRRKVEPGKRKGPPLSG